MTTSIETEPETESDNREMARLLSQAVVGELPASAMSAGTRVQLIDLLEVPRGPIDRSAYL